MSKIVVIGASAKYNSPLEIYPNVQNVFYSYNRTKNTEFDSCLIMRFSLDSYWGDRRNAKIYKILPHLFVETDYSIWVDDIARLPESPEGMIKKYLNTHNLAVFGILCSKTIDDQIVKIKRRKKEDPELVDAQVASYHKEGCPLKQANATIILRRHTPEIVCFNLAWWEQICKWSSRDQLSFPYVAWRLKTDYTTIPGDIYSYRQSRKK